MLRWLGARRVIVGPCGSRQDGGAVGGGWGPALDGKFLGSREAASTVASWFFGSRTCCLREVIPGMRRHSDNWWLGGMACRSPSVQQRCQAAHGGGKGRRVAGRGNSNRLCPLVDVS
jgi:hypothetical protein